MRNTFGQIHPQSRLHKIKKKKDNVESENNQK